MPPSNFVDLTGKPFEYWVVLARAANDKRGQTRWLCQCRCGTQRIVYGVNLTRRLSKSCGCHRKEVTRRMRTTHGLSTSSEFDIWNMMLQRCLNPRNKSYHNYGARGITVWKSWQSSFQTFYGDMGPRPSPQHTLERRNNNLGYDKDNSYWGTLSEQSRNKRTSRLLTYNNITQCLQAWAEEKHLNPGTITTRLDLGWSIEEALTTPVDLEYIHKRNLHKPRLSS